MRYIKKYDELLNEGLLNMFKSLFKGVKKMYTNIKGGKKLEETLIKYQVEIDKLFSKLTNAEQTSNAAKVTEGLDDNPSDDETETNTNTTATLDAKTVREFIKKTKNQIEVLKKRFIKEIDMFVNKNNTDKLQELSFLTKNQFEDYVYSKYEEVMTTANDTQSLKKIVKLRNEMKQKMADDIKKINADTTVQKTKNEENSQIINLNSNYMYLNNDGVKVYVNVIEINKDDKGKDNNLLAKVKNKKGNEFYVLKTKLSQIKKGETYDYINKEGKENKVTIEEVDENGNISSVKNTETGDVFDPIDANLTINN